MPVNIRVVIIDDHPMFREGVARTLNSETNIEVVGEGENLVDAVSLAENLLPDIILLDISMPGGGIEAAGAIARTCPVMKIAMLTVSEREDDVMNSLHAGACGYILKGIGGQELIAIVSSLYRGNPYISPGLAARMLTELKNKPLGDDAADQDKFSELTAREEQILKRVSRGLSNKEIGRELELTEKTIKHYVTNVLQKLRVRNRVEAALLAQKRILEASDLNRRVTHFQGTDDLSKIAQIK
ncbi:MAG: response regulator transcription factor [Nitrosomonadaceae bacterium]